MKIFVTVGTSKFDDLVKELDKTNHKIIFQIGAGKYLPKKHNYFRYAQNMNDFYSWADIVITHGGAGTIFELLKSGIKTIAVPNLKISDNHQLEIVKKLTEEGYLSSCNNYQLLPLLIDNISNTKFKKYKKGNNFFVGQIKQKYHPWLDIIKYEKADNQVTDDYIVITPVRNEEKYIEKLIKSMMIQRILPKKWVIVNDGSTDKTEEIVKKYLHHDWIKLINLKNRGHRKLGSGVVDAFNEGYNSLNKKEKEIEFIVKLDADLAFSNDYFSRLLKEFEMDPELGIAGGQSYVQVDDKVILERTNSSHVRGATKIYRMNCLKNIGWLVSHLGWDTIDELTAQMNGWKTKTIKDVIFLNFRPIASSTGPWVRGKYREGYISYYLDYHPLYFFARCLRQSFEKPRLIGSMFMFCGWLFSVLTLRPKYEMKRVRKYLRKKQIKKIIELII